LPLSYRRELCMTVGDEASSGCSAAVSLRAGSDGLELWAAPLNVTAKALLSVTLVTLSAL